MVRDIGTEYDITDTLGDLPIISIPVGDEGVGQTLVNDGTVDLFWRERDVSNTPVGIAAVLVADPFFMSRLQPGEFTHKAGITIQVVCADGETSTLRVAPGRLYQSGDVDLAQMSTAIGETTDVPLAGETAEGATARTGISLWKRAVNKLIDIKALLTGTRADAARTTATLVIPVQVIDAVGVVPDYVAQKTADDAIGLVGDGSAVAGAVGTLSAKQRLMTTQLDNIQTATEAATGSGLTFTRVPINTSGVLALAAKVGSQKQRLHALVITVDAQDTIEIRTIDDANLAGPWDFGAGGGVVIPFNAHPEGAIQAATVNQGIELVVSGGNNCRGYAIVSTGV